MKPEVLEMNEEVCGGVRTLQITAKRGLDAEEDSTTARSASRSAPRAYTHAAAASHSRMDVWPLRPGAPLLCQCLVAFLCGACSLHPPPSLALSASLSLCQDLSLVSRPSAGCFATKKVSITV